MVVTISQEDNKWLEHDIPLCPDCFACHVAMRVVSEREQATAGEQHEVRTGER